MTANAQNRGNKIAGGGKKKKLTSSEMRKKKKVSHPGRISLNMPKIRCTYLHLKNGY